MSRRELTGSGGALPEACPDYMDDLSAWIDAELPAAREEELRAHLAGCTHCEEAVARLRGVDLALADVPLPEANVPGTPPVGFVDFFLVTAENFAGEGTMGYNSAGVERPNLTPCP